MDKRCLEKKVKNSFAILSYFFAAGVQADEKGGKLKARWVISLKN